MAPHRMNTLSFVVLPIIIILAGFLYSTSSLCPILCSRTCSSDAKNLHSGYFEYECAGKPHHSTWSSWWHPQRSDGTAAEHRQGAGATTNDWNILYHLGGNGPWVEKIVDIVDGGIAVPEGCQVEQVHMVGQSWLGQNIEKRC
jgi:acid phosphatase